jgi:hypothetical protein
MIWEAAPTGRRGRQQTHCNASIQTRLSMKVLFGMALRQATGFVESLLRLVGLNRTAELVPSSRPANRQTLEANNSGRYRAQRGAPRVEIPRSRDLAKLERLPPPKPRRDETSRDHAAHNPAGQWMHCLKLLEQSPPLTDSANVLPGGAWHANLIARLPNFRSAPQC